MEKQLYSGIWDSSRKQLGTVIDMVGKKKESKGCLVINTKG